MHVKQINIHGFKSYKDQTSFEPFSPKHNVVDAKRSKIDELLDYIEQRLEELETEKEELKQFHELDKERRCLEELQDELQTLDQSIANKEAELAAVMPEYNDAVSQEQQALQRERDAFLNAEIRELEDNITSNDERLNAIETEVVNSRRQLRELRDSVESGDHNMESFRDEIDANALHRELWRNEQKSQSALQTAQDEFSKAERMLLSSVDRSTSSAIQAIKRIASKMNLQGVYGPLYELFEVDDRYKTAVEVIGGASLFHVVVDTDDTASLLLEQLNRDRSGRVTFMPLNRLRPKETTYPAANDAVPMVKRLQFDPAYTKAFLQVFGRAIICPSLEIAAHYARQDNLNAVTLDGDRADRKGSLTGGYIDARKSKLEMVKAMKTWDRRLTEAKESLAKTKQELQDVESDLARCRDRLVRLEARKAELTNMRESIAMDKRTKVREEQQITEAISKKTEQSEGNRGLERQQRNLERYLQKKALLIKRKDECSRNIRDLGVLPEEALRDDAVWGTMPSKRLLSRLHEVNESLKRFGHVNKKAFEQYNNFTKQRDSLNTRKDELDESAKAIEDLIQVLDQRKDEAIERTFKQVALHFGEVWRKLVPNGRGKLVMISKMTSAGEAGDDDDDGRGEEMEDIETQGSSSRLKSSIDRYSGVGISVSFSTSRRRGTGDMDDGEDGDGEEAEAAEETQELKRMNQLSGGQKSLVALALIFAIQ
ncbi:Structural maintenance of chromosomes protein 3, partial [Cladochytrium tenue]